MRFVMFKKLFRCDFLYIRRSGGPLLKAQGITGVVFGYVPFEWGIGAANSSAETRPEEKIMIARRG